LLSSSTTRPGRQNAEPCVGLRSPAKAFDIAVDRSGDGYRSIRAVGRRQGSSARPLQRRSGVRPQRTGGAITWSSRKARSHGNGYAAMANSSCCCLSANVRTICDGVCATTRMSDSISAALAHYAARQAATKAGLITSDTPLRRRPAARFACQIHDSARRPAGSGQEPPFGAQPLLVLVPPRQRILAFSRAFKAFRRENGSMPKAKKVLRMVAMLGTR
jgi:hypothetical protein